MRIISGKYRGRLITPPNNLRARPTTDFAKENFFNILNNYFDFHALDVLDLFAGTGSISYEFASREVQSVTAVEINAVHYNFIRKSTALFGFDNLHPTKANVFLYVKSCKRQFDLIFADPPYDLEGLESLPTLIFEHNLLSENGWFVLEHGKTNHFENYPNYCETRNYGSVHFSIFKKDGQGKKEAEKNL